MARSPKYDNNSMIIGNESVKRAIEIAEKTGEKILLITRPDHQNISHDRIISWYPCPCGFRGCEYQKCICKEDEIREHRRRKPKTGMVAKSVKPKFKQVIEAYKIELSGQSLQLIKKYYEKKPLSPKDIDRLVKRACKIAELENDTKIQTPHIAEAVSYQQWPLRLDL